MINVFKNIDFLTSSTYAIIGVVFDVDIKYNVLVLIRNKEKINILKQFSTSEFIAIQKEIKTAIPILLNFSGKGVINKKVQAKGNYLKEVLFNANPEDFYTYTLFENSLNFVSICRKEQIDVQLSTFKENNYKALDFSIGPFVSSLSIKMIKENVLDLESYQLRFENETLIDFNPKKGNETEYQLGDDSLKHFSIVNFSTFLNFLHPSNKIEYDSSLLSGNIKDQKLKKIFDSFAVGTLVFFLLALLGSYLLLGYYNGKYVDFEKQLYHFNDSYSQIKKMEEDLQNKKFIVQNSGVLNKRFLSYYTDKIANSVPNEIILTSLKVNPSLKKIKDEEGIELEANTILINGETANSFFTNKWVKELKKYDWINKIEILNLGKTNKNLDTFSLKITTL
jgi:hypothetical protein